MWSYLDFYSQSTNAYNQYFARSQRLILKRLMINHAKLKKSMKRQGPILLTFLCAVVFQDTCWSRKTATREAKQKLKCWKKKRFFTYYRNEGTKHTFSSETSCMIFPHYLPPSESESFFTRVSLEAKITKKSRLSQNFPYQELRRRIM